MPKLSERGAAHLLVPLILLLGIGAGVYLTVTGNLKLFSRASNPAIVFKSSSGQVLTNNSSGIPQTTSPTVKIELTSTLGAPVFQIPQPPSDIATPQPEPQAPEPSAQTSPVGVGTTGSTLGEATSSVQVSGTTSYKLAENPTDLDKASDVSYVSHPAVLDYTFKNPNPGTKFIWVEFKDVSGKVDRQTAQIELVSAISSSASASSCTPCSADVSGKKDSQGNIVPDGYINGADASAVIGRGCFNKTTADKDKFSRQCSYLDANGDGKIDMADLNCIKSQFLKKCEARPTPTVTPTPTPSPSPASVVGFGKAANFVGSGGLVGQGPPLQLQTFTVEAWVKWEGGIQDNQYIFYKRLYPTNIGSHESSFGLYIQRPSYAGYDQYDRLVASVNKGNSYAVIETDNSLKDKEWHHLAIENNASYNSFSLYVDGVSKGIVYSSSIPYNNGGFYIGTYADALPYKYFTGKIDEVRVSNISRYRSNFARPISPFIIDQSTVALLRFDGNFSDSSVQGNHFSPLSYVGFVDSTVPATASTPTPIPTVLPTPIVTVTPIPQSSSVKRVFVTSSAYDANLKSAGSNIGLGEATNGLDGADKICQAKANEASLGGTWKAWLSDSKTAAASRLSHFNGQYKLLNGSIVASNWTDLITQNSIGFDFLSSPINVNEQVKVVADRAVWTNTNTNGTIWNNGVTNGSCRGTWATLYLNAVGRIGHSGKSNFQWTSYSDLDCSIALNTASLYCFEQ